MGNYDGIMIGAGHNALVCAAYMARSGLKVGIFESEEEIGGGSSTLEYLLPGYRSNMHANFFIGLDDFPIMSDLDLGRYGFRWLTPPRCSTPPSSATAPPSSFTGTPKKARPQSPGSRKRTQKHFASYINAMPLNSVRSCGVFFSTPRFRPPKSRSAFRAKKAAIFSPSRR